MLSINRIKSHTQVIWHDYVKSMENLESYIIDLFFQIENLGGDLIIMYYVNINKIEVE